MVSWSRTYTPGFDDLTLGGTELEEIESLGILGATLDAMLTFEIILWEIVSKAARSLGVVLHTVKLFDWPRMSKNCLTHILIQSGA